MNIIEIKNLKKYFKEVKAVNDISFSVVEGEFFAFLGLNGAGKSTTINIMCGALSADDGSVIIDSRDVKTEMNKIKRELGVVFQNSVLDGGLSAMDNLKTRAAMYGMTSAEFKESLAYLSEKLELTDILNRSLNKLSGGQKRRVDIARALIHSPKILILDEPTTGLDPKTRMLVWALISELRAKKNLTVFLTTHYMEEAALADQVVIMDSGKIVASGSPNELKNKYANDFIRLYKYSPSIEQIAASAGLKTEKTKAYLEIIVKNTEEAKEFLVKNADKIEDFEVIKGNMDNVFLKVTGKNLKEVM